MQALEKRMADIQQRFERTHASYESLISSDEERRLHDSFKSELAQSMNLRTAVDPVSSPFFSMLALGWVGLAHSPDG
jgi:hypothetical protein